MHDYQLLCCTPPDIRSKASNKNILETSSLTIECLVLIHNPQTRMFTSCLDGDVALLFDVRTYHRYCHGRICLIEFDLQSF
jgi:hypothetical protein